MIKSMIEATKAATGGLALRLIAVMTLAILPLALISFYQTAQVIKETTNLAESVLLDNTGKAANNVQKVIQAAIGSARAMAAAESVFLSDPAICTQVTQAILETSREYVMAGVIEGDGTLRCGAATGPAEQFIGKDLLDKIQQGDPDAEFWSSTRRIGEDGPIVLSVAVPIQTNGTDQAYVWISIPYPMIHEMLRMEGSTVDLLLFGSSGVPLAADFTKAELHDFLPKEKELVDFVYPVSSLHRGLNRAGVERQFAVVPIIQDQIFVMGSWEPEVSAPFPLMGRVMALYFPLLMWVAGVVVAYFGTHRLVIRHIQRLRVWMRLYAAGRTEVEDAHLDNAPEEMEAVAQSFREMANRLSRQERQREEDLAEKTILLKEVHHRVKNNLQLICSIMNMQVRHTKTMEAKRLLRRVQDRVMALAAIHRYLYTARKLSMVRADKLLEDIINQLVIVGGMDGRRSRVNISTDLAPVEITPEQSVPLSLMACEAATNAVKYCGIEGGTDGQPWISIVLGDLGDNKVCFSVVNSKGDVLAEEKSGVPSLGSKLIRSFASQLQGQIEVEDKDERYGVHVTFEVMPEECPDANEEPETVPAGLIPARRH
ncbi:two-component sensor histidine kinase [Donghicola tyrosinivorans]|uniref:histidine kinase n=2 Tax=Donghicola tyrosinivorans TaxID=1652492 RepID=A0A2T0WF88_9RHOB|nr:two-component sensor histidine kinase [Donghicola tyrosinivorans]